MTDAKSKIQCELSKFRLDNYFFPEGKRVCSPTHNDKYQKRHKSDTADNILKTYCHNNKTNTYSKRTLLHEL